MADENSNLDCETIVFGSTSPQQAQSSSVELPSEMLTVGTILCDTYILRARLGRGGMGEVWKADEVYEGEILRTVVIKTLAPDVQNVQDELTRIQSMFHKIHSLQHQHICPMYAMKNDPKAGTIIVMKFIDGMMLQEYYAQYVRLHGNFPVSEVVKMLLPIAQALDYSHSKKVMHRDVKPQNILVSKDESDGVQLIDFGLVMEMRSSMATGSTSAHFDTSGTLPYMSPEQWSGEFQDARSDQFSLAVVVYELLAGHLPFTGANMQILGFQILNKSPEPISDVPDYVNFALQKALAKNRKERFLKCEDFILALQNSENAAETITTVRNTTAPKHSHKTSTHNPSASGTLIPLLLGGGILLLLVLVIAVVLFLSKESKKLAQLTQDVQMSQTENSRQVVQPYAYSNTNQPNFTIPTQVPAIEVTTPPQPNESIQSQVQPESETKSEPEAKPETESQPEVKPEIQPETASQPDVQLEPISQPETKPGPETKPEVQPEPASQPEVNPEPETKPDVQPEPASQPELNHKPETKPDVQPEPASQPELNPKPETKPDVQPEPALQPEVKPEPETKPEVQPEPASQSEVKPEPETKPEVQPEPASQSEVKPEPEVKPEAQPESEKPQTPDELLQAAQKSVNAGDFVTAYEAYSQLPLEQLEETDLENYAKVCENIGRHVTAVKIRTIQISQNPTKEILLAGLHDAVEGMKFREVFEWSDLYLKDAPNDEVVQEYKAYSMSHLAGILEEPSLARKSMEIYNQLVTRNPQNAEHYAERGYVYFSNPTVFSKAFDFAKADFEHALSLDPACTDALLFQGIMFRVVFSQPLKAYKNFSQILQNNPNFEEANLQIAMTLMDEKPEAALESFGKYLEKHPERWDVFEMRGNLLFQQEQFAKAITDFTLCVNNTERNFAVLKMRALASTQLQHWRDAKEDFDFLIENDPEKAHHVEYYHGLGNVYEGAGQRRKAQQAHDKAEQIKRSLI